MNQPVDPVQGMIDRLREVSVAVRDLEENAKKLLYEKQDKEGYKKTLLEKTDLLINILKRVEDFFDDLPKPLATMARDRLGHFSFSASKAKDVDSVF